MKIIKMARRAGDAEVRRLYREVYGADFGGRVTVERARESVIEACEELVNHGRQDMTTAEFQAEVIKKLDAILNNLTSGPMTAAEVAASPANRKAVNPEKEPGVARSMAAEADAEIKDYVREHPGAKVFKISLNRARGYLPEKKPAVTLEELRDVATRYSAAFGMEELLKLNVRHGGAKKLSLVDPAEYAGLAAEMRERLDRDGKAPTREELKAKAVAFVAKAGEPALVALLRAFKADRLSAVAEDKVAAFAEALDNA